MYAHCHRQNNWKKKRGREVSVEPGKALTFCWIGWVHAIAHFHRLYFFCDDLFFAPYLRNQNISPPPSRGVLCLEHANFAGANCCLSMHQWLGQQWSRFIELYIINMFNWLAFWFLCVWFGVHYWLPREFGLFWKHSNCLAPLRNFLRFASQSGCAAAVLVECRYVDYLYSFKFSLRRFGDGVIIYSWFIFFRPIFFVSKSMAADVWYFGVHWLHASPLSDCVATTDADPAWGIGAPEPAVCWPWAGRILDWMGRSAKLYNKLIMSYQLYQIMIYKDKMYIHIYCM